MNTHTNYYSVNNVIKIYKVDFHGHVIGKRKKGKSKRVKLIENKKMNGIATINSQKMLLAFGGVDRLEELHELFCNVILTKPQRVLLSDELSNTIFKHWQEQILHNILLAGIKLSKQKKGKLSHVIGSILSFSSFNTYNNTNNNTNNNTIISSIYNDLSPNDSNNGILSSDTLGYEQ